jgi:hemerythrin-like domain-containing protein
MKSPVIEMMSPIEETQSFLSLLDVHRRLDELFYLHQEALLALDVALAIERLEEFERELRPHMLYEEEVLLPVYARAGRIEGGPEVFFTGEHKRMLEFLARFREKLEGLRSDPRDLKREIIALFDHQAMFKHLVEHHDLREQNILYPTLDKLTDEGERRRLLDRE